MTMRTPSLGKAGPLLLGGAAALAAAALWNTARARLAEVVGAGDRGVVELAD